MTISVSVVVNCYNGEKFIEKALQSLVVQTQKPSTIIFFNNGSTDSSADIATRVLSEFNLITRTITPENQLSLGEARKKALDLVDDDIVMFLDVDDCWQENKIRDQVQFMRETGADLVYSSYTVVDEFDNYVSQRSLKSAEVGIGSLLLNYDVNMSSVAISMSFLRSKKLNFEKRFFYCPDFDLFNRVAVLGRVWRMSETLVHYRISDGSLTKQLINIRGKEIRHALARISHLLRENRQGSLRLSLLNHVCIFFCFVKSLFYDI